MVLGVSKRIINKLKDEGAAYMPDEAYNEEYYDILIPIEKYEQAANINRRKVENELKQEIFGY
jgi:hypothetical protein